MTPHARRQAACNALDDAQREVRLAQQRAELHAADPQTTGAEAITTAGDPLTAGVASTSASVHLPADYVALLAEAAGVEVEDCIDGHIGTVLWLIDGRAVRLVSEAPRRCRHTVRNATGACTACGQRVRAAGRAGGGGVKTATKIRPYEVGQEAVLVVGVGGVVDSIDDGSITINGVTLPMRLGRDRGHIQYASMDWPEGDETTCSRGHCDDGSCDCEPGTEAENLQDDLDRLERMIRDEHDAHHGGDPMRFCDHAICREVDA